MPQLYVFVVCEKVIIEEQTGLASLIGLFTTISGSVPAEVDVSPNAIVAEEWCLFSAWKWLPDDPGKEFKQQGEIRYPDGTVFMRIPEVKFRMEPEKIHQNRGMMVGFPVGQTGIYTIEMWLDHDDSRVFGPVSIEVAVKREIKSPIS